MTTISRSALVPYTPAEMYAIVNDVEAYPDFIKWCKKGEVLQATAEEVSASLTLSYSGIERSFATCNRIHPPKMIEVRLLDGPFKHLDGYWRFEDIQGKGCNIRFDLEFELAGRLVDVAFGHLFSKMANALVDCFCQRAVELYGPRQLA